MFSKRSAEEVLFYYFLTGHSFLIGLFPFYIPVFLYAKGFSIPLIAIFVAITGVSYCCSLYLWDRLRLRVGLSWLILFSFGAEIVLLSFFLFEKSMLLFLVLAGVVNGVYNCFFWITQRLLFVETVTLQDSGRKFGNAQVYVFVILKTAIFFGGILLEHMGFPAIYCVSGATVLLVGWILFRQPFGFGQVKYMSEEPLSIQAVLTFRDKHRSKWIFIIDGIFLYLESYFWVISLYILVSESFARLGVLVVLLTLFFGAVFISIKNSVDSLPANIVYVCVVGLYLLSWLLRAMADDFNGVGLLILLAVITFATSLFRLIFNKRFFDHAKASNGYRYIVLKSYYSQISLLILPVLTVLLAFGGTGGSEVLPLLFLIAAGGTCFYLFYGKPYGNIERR